MVARGSCLRLAVARRGLVQFLTALTACCFSSGLLTLFQPSFGSRHIKRKREDLWKPPNPNES
jgi:hypothetical protein